MIIIERKNINEFAQELAEKNIVMAPIKRKEQDSAFEVLKKGVEIDFDYALTPLSIKDFFLPAKEEIFFLRNRKISHYEREKKFIIFGLNSDDLEAIGQLDEIMFRPKKDYFYFKKRERTTIVGIIDENFKISRIGDLILVKINTLQYQAIPITEKGKIIIKNKFFRKEAGLIVNSGEKNLREMPKLHRLLSDPEFLSEAVAWSWKNSPEIWEELAGLCLGCGICSYVCPLCYCFSIEDTISLDNKKCSRCKKWDSCVLPRFNQVSGGYNFHKTIKERYYNWFFHKFVRAYKEYGKSQCIACSRCKKYCPARIDIEKYLLKIVENYKKSVL